MVGRNQRVGAAMSVSKDNSIVRARVSMPNDGMVQTRGPVGVFHAIEKNVKTYTDINDQIGLGENLYYHELDKSLMLMPNWIRGEFSDMDAGWKDIIGETRDVFPMNPSWCGSCKASFSEWGGEHKVAMKIESIDQFEENRVLVVTQFNSPIDVGNHRNSVSKYLTSGELVDSFITGDTPSHIAYDGTYMWVVNELSHSVTKMNLDGTIVGTYKTGGYNPIYVTFDNTFADVYVVNSLSNAISRLDAATGDFIWSYFVGFRPTSVVFANGFLWATNYNDGTVVKINITNGDLTPIPVGPKPTSIAYHNTYLWVTTAGNNKVNQISVGGALLSSVLVGRRPSCIISGGSYMWVANKDDNTISKVSNGGTVETFYAGFTPASIAWDGSTIWVANYGSSEIVRMSAAGAIMNTINAEFTPSSIAYAAGSIWANNAPQKKSTFLQVDFGLQVDSLGRTIDGSGYRLEWKSDQYPMFYSPVDDITGERVALSRYNVTQDELLGYIKGGAAQWGFMPVDNGEMIITCTAFSGRWVVKGLENKNNNATPIGMPAGRVSVLVDGLASSVNVHAVTFPEFGMCKTGWIRLDDFDIMVEEIEKFLVVTYPYYPGRDVIKKGGAYIGIGERKFVKPEDATEQNPVVNMVKAYIFLRSGNYSADKGYGTVTPIVRGWQVLAPPEYQQPTSTPPVLDISEFVKNCSVSLNQDPSTDTVTLELENTRNWTSYNINGEPVEDMGLLNGILSSGLPLNYLSCEVDYGYVEDGVPNWVDNTDVRTFKGVIPASSWSANMGKDNLSVTIKSSAQRCLQTEMYNAPCLMGFAIDEAIATIGVWSGMPAEKIFIHAEESPNAQWRKSGIPREVIMLPASTEINDNAVSQPTLGQPLYDMINDYDDTTYIMQASATEGFTTSFGIGANTIPYGACINKIKMFARAKGYTPVSLFVETGTAASLPDPDLPPTNRYTQYAGIADGEWRNFEATWNKNPNTQKKWTIDDITTLNIGASLRNPGEDVCCSQLYIIVYYIEPSLDIWGRPLVDTPDMEWTYLNDDVAIDNYLTGDEFNMENPTWLNNQQKGWEVMAKIADKFGYYLYFESDNLHIERIRHKYPVPTAPDTPSLEFCYDGAGTIENSYKLRDLNVTPIENDTCNVVVGEGTDFNGSAIMSCDIDYGSIEDPDDINFVGYRLSHRFIDSEINEQRYLNAVTRIYMSSHRAGKLNMSGSTIFKNGWWLRPGMVFALQTGNLIVAGGRNWFRIKTISITSGIDTVWTINITAEDIDQETPYTYTTMGSKPAFMAIRYLINAMRPLAAHLQAPDNNGRAVFIRDPLDPAHYNFTMDDFAGAGLDGVDILS
jgi:hypothetical protein